MKSTKRYFVPQLLAIGALLIVGSADLQAEKDTTSQILAGLTVKAELQPTKAVFQEIDSCRAQMSEGTLKQRFTLVEGSLVHGLLIGWSPGWLKKSPQPHYMTLQSVIAETEKAKQGTGRPLSPPPQMYLRNLRNDAAVCQAAVGKHAKSKEAVRILVGVVDDLDLKFRDCYLKGMGRLVGISVETEKATKPDGGWTVYFKWLTVSDIPTSESTFPALSTPAKNNLPPGIYQLRAERKDSKTGAVLKSESKTVSLDGTNDNFELQVP
jgi:hypothetical protein